MAGQVKIAVGLLVLITAAKQFNAADEEPRSIATEALTAHGQENNTSLVQEGSDLYKVELCNPFYQYWKEHSDVWTVRSTDGYTGKCKRQTLISTNTTGVLLNTSEINVVTQEFTSVVKFWTFEDDNSTSFKESYLGEYRDYLLYQNDNKTCAVFRRDWFWYHTEEGKQKYEEKLEADKKKKSNDTDWARCLNTSRTGQPICTSRPTHDLRVIQGHQDNVPQDCKDKYDKERGTVRADVVKYNAEDCKKYQQTKND